MGTGTRWQEELASSVTHGLGLVASVIGGMVLIVFASLTGDPFRIVSAALYVAGLVTLYTASTLYHSARKKAIKARLKVFDHCAIYLMIAGSYMPFLLVGLKGAWGWSLFGVILGISLGGIVLKLFATGRFPRISTGIYIAMGWLVIIALGPMLRNLPLKTLLWLFAGGVAFTAGTFFYHNRRIPYTHAIWHLFVLIGSVCHYFAVFSQVVATP